MDYFFSSMLRTRDLVAKDRVGWRVAVLVGAKNYEENMTESIAP